jgi:hypothetical protein
MMTPKEKANHIIKLCRMAVGTPINKTKSWCYSRHAKNCALVVVDEIMDVIDWHEFETPKEELHYWNKVKEEINKF